MPCSNNIYEVYCGMECWEAIQCEGETKKQIKARSFKTQGKMVFKGDFFKDMNFTFLWGCSWLKHKQLPAISFHMPVILLIGPTCHTGPSLMLCLLTTRMESSASQFLSFSHELLQSRRFCLVYYYCTLHQSLKTHQPAWEVIKHWLYGLPNSSHIMLPINQLIHSIASEVSIILVWKALL